VESPPDFGPTATELLNTVLPSTGSCVLAVGGEGFGFDDSNAYGMNVTGAGSAARCGVAAGARAPGRGCNPAPRLIQQAGERRLPPAGSRRFDIEAGREQDAQV